MNLADDPSTSVRVDAVREAFRRQRCARQLRRLWLFYFEHCLIEEAQAAWLQVLVELRAARRSWRVALGMA